MNLSEERTELSRLFYEAKEAGYKDTFANFRELLKNELLSEKVKQEYQEALLAKGFTGTIYEFIEFQNKKEE